MTHFFPDGPLVALRLSALPASEQIERGNGAGKKGDAAEEDVDANHD
jgi:hypothetical protein